MAVHFIGGRNWCTSMDQDLF